MKNTKRNLTREDLNFITAQKTLFLLDIVIGIITIFILANIFLIFTKNVFSIGILPILIGLGYSTISLKKRIKHVRDYWK